MKILFFTDHFYPEMSAPAAHVYERCKIWVSDGHDVTVITNVPNAPIGRPYPGYVNKWKQIEDLSGVRVVRVKTFMAENKGTLKRTLDYLTYMASAFFFALFEKKPDVVISTSPHLFVAVSATFYAMARRVPHVFEVRDLWPHSIAATTSMTVDSFAYKILERLELFMYRRAKRVIVLTPSFVENLAGRGIPRNKIDLVLNGANLDLFVPSSPDMSLQSELNLDGQFVVGYLGTLGLPHGLENAIRAAKLLEGDDVTFLFVGEGAAKESLISLADELNVNNVRFVPRQNKEDIPKYWSLCSAGLVHLKNDPLFSTVIPSKIFETMALGLPILYVGPQGDGSSIVEEREAGLTIEPAQPEHLADAIRKLKNDPALWSRLSQNSRNAAPDFSRSNQADKTLRSLSGALS